MKALKIVLVVVSVLVAAHFVNQYRHHPRVTLRQDAGPGSGITAVGDSVMLASAPALQKALPDISVNAAVGRQFATGVRLIGWLARHGELRHTVVVGLGTNGPIAPADMRQLLAETGSRRLILVSTYEARPWETEVNHALAAAAHGNVSIADWHGVVASHPGLLVDGIHPGPVGQVLYAMNVADAVRRAR